MQTSESAPIEHLVTMDQCVTTGKEKKEPIALHVPGPFRLPSL